MTGGGREEEGGSAGSRQGGEMETVSKETQHVDRTLYFFDWIEEIPWSDKRGDKEFGITALNNRGVSGFLCENMIEVTLNEMSKALQGGRAIHMVRKGRAHEDQQTRNIIFLPRVISSLRDEASRLRVGNRFHLSSLRDEQHTFLFPTIIHSNHWILIALRYDRRCAYILDPLCEDRTSTTRDPRGIEGARNLATTGEHGAREMAELTIGVIEHIFDDQTNAPWQVKWCSAFQQEDNFNCGVFAILHTLLLCETNQDWLATMETRTRLRPPQEWLMQTRTQLIEALTHLEKMEETAQVILRSLPKEARVQENLTSTTKPEEEVQPNAIQRLMTSTTKLEEEVQPHAIQRLMTSTTKLEEEVQPIAIQRQATSTKPQPRHLGEEMEENAQSGEKTSQRGKERRGERQEEQRGNDWAQMHRKSSDPGFLISQNVNGCNHFVLKHILAYLIQSFQPGVVLLQEVRVSARDENKLRKMIKENWACYRIFLGPAKINAKKGKGDLRLVTLVHAALSPSPSPAAHQACNKEKKYRNRVFSIKVGTGKNSFLVTNLHQVPAENAIREQGELWAELLHLALGTKETHIIAGDFNAARTNTTTPMRRGYSPSSITAKADERFEKFLADLSAHRTLSYEQISETGTTFTFSTWYKQELIEAKLDAVLAIHPPSDEDNFPNISLQSWTVDGCVIGGAVDHRALVVQVHTKFTSEETQLIPRVEVHQMNSRQKKGETPKSRWVLDRDSWEEKKIEWAQQLDANIRDMRAKAQECNICEMLANSLPLKEVKIRKGGRRHSNKEQMDLKRSIRNLRTKLREASQQSPATGVPTEATLQRELRTKIERFRTICEEQNNEVFQEICQQQQTRLGTVGSRESQNAMGRKNDFIPKEPMISQDIKKKHPNSLRCHKGLALRLLGKIVDNADELINQLEATLSSEDTRGVRAFWSANQQLMIGIEREGTDDWIFLSLLPANTITKAIVALEESDKTTWEIAGYRDLTDHLPMQKVRELEDADHTRFFFSVNACTKQGTCSKCSNIGCMLPLADSSDETIGGGGITPYCTKCKSFTTVAPRRITPPEGVQLSRRQQQEITRPLAPGEIDVWLASAPRRKAAGLDLISNEVLRALPPACREEVGKLVNAALEGKAEVLNKTARVRLLPKNQFCHILENMRPICVMSTLTRLVQAILAHRLSKTVEANNVLTNFQEGFRPGRSTSRQAHRLISIVEEAEEAKTSLILLYLDFANFFNNVAIEVVEQAMNSLGFHPEDIRTVIACNSGVELQIQTNEFNTGKIPLMIGLPQGGASSPQLANLVLCILSRQLDKCSTGTTNNLSFADDMVLIAHTMKEMRELVAVVDSFCKWSGLQINNKKSEITSFDYARKGEVPGANKITVMGEPVEALPATKPFKYLGYRISLWKEERRRIKGCPFTWGERAYVFEKTKELINNISSSSYTPAQKFYLVKVGILNVFRYSAVMTGWTWRDLQELDQLWIRAFKKALGLSKSTGNGIFYLPTENGGLQVPHPAPILGRAALRYIEREVNSKHGGDIQDRLISKLRNSCVKWGCQTMLELQREMNFRTMERDVVRGPEALAVWLAEKLNTRISWAHIEAGHLPGSISLLHRMEDMVANLNDCNRPQGWTNFQALWRQLPKLQFSLLRNVRPIADEELHLPRKLWPFPRQREEAEGIVMQLLQENVIWVSSVNRASGTKRKRREVVTQDSATTRKRKSHPQSEEDREETSKKHREAAEERRPHPAHANTRSLMAKLLGNLDQQEHLILKGKESFKIKGDIAIMDRPRSHTGQEQDIKEAEPSLRSAPFARKEDEDGAKNPEKTEILLQIAKHISKKHNSLLNSQAWWEHLTTAMAEIRDRQQGLPLSYEFLEHLGMLAETKQFSNWPTLYHPTIQAATDSLQDDEVRREIIWIDQQEQYLSHAACESGTIMIGWNQTCFRKEIPDGFMLVGKVPKGSEICYAANFWRTGDRSLRKSQDDLIVYCKESEQERIIVQLTVHLIPEQEELQEYRRKQNENYQASAKQEKNRNHVWSAIHGDISRNRKGRSMSIGYSTQDKEGEQERGAIKIHGKCSVIRAHTIALCILLQAIWEQRGKQKTIRKIFVLFKSTRMHRFLTDTLRWSTMQYEDELVYDLAGRLQECLSKFQREGIEINLSLIADHTVVQEAAEEARKGKSSFSSTWERALIDSDLGFCIADEENFKPGMDRLKIWDKIIREEQLELRRKEAPLTLTETFLLEPQVGRRILGRALQRCRGSVLRTAIQAITWSAPTRKKLFQWKKTTSPCCPWCEGREESWVHIQLACKEFELMIALAHNRVMETIKGCLTESWKKKSVEQESWWQTPINSMTGLGLTAPEHGNLIPDGLCYFRGSNRIVLVEIARTSEFTGEGSSLANLKAKFQEKEQKYAALRAEMTSRSDNTEVIQATFIAGVRGSIMEREWTTNFRNLLMDEDMIDRAMTKIVIQLLEVQHMLWTSRRRGDTTNREQA